MGTRKITRTHTTLPAPKLLRVAAYARVSVAAEKNLHSLHEQVSYYKGLICTNPAWVFAGVFVDEGISGTSSTKRQGFKELMDKARLGEIDLIYTKSISRWGRNTLDVLNTVRELKALGVGIVFERERIDTRQSEGELLLTLLASFAQEESRSLSENVKWAIRKRFKEGIANNRVVYGYRWMGDHFEIDETEADIVRLVFDNYLQGISPEKTAAQLNKQGFVSRYSKPFTPGFMRKLLENTRYKGIEHLQQYYVPTPGAGSVKNDGVLPSFVVEGSIPAIIEPDVFDAVQQEIKRRRACGSLALTPSLNTGCFTSRIRCGACGKHYQRKTKTTKTRSYKFWRCWSACTGQGNPCGGHNIRETTLKHAACRAMSLEVFDEKAVFEQVTEIVAFSDKLSVHLTDGRVCSFALDEKGQIV